MVTVLLRKWCHSSKHFADLAPHHGGKTAGIDMVWIHYVTVTVCIRHITVVGLCSLSNLGLQVRVHWSDFTDRLVAVKSSRSAVFVCLCARTTEWNDLWPRYLSCWFASTLFRSSSMAKIIVQSSRLHDDKFRYGCSRLSENWKVRMKSENQSRHRRWKADLNWKL